jgi:formate transporter
MSESNKNDAAPDVLPPAEMARETAAAGKTKAELATPSLVTLGLLAGAYIAFGSLFATVTLAGADRAAFGQVQLLAGLAFSLGLILVLIGGAELFTGNTLMIVSGAEGDARVGPITRALALAWVTNFVGSVAIVGLAFAAGVHTAGEGRVGISALETAQTKAAKSFAEVLASGVLANMLVCLAVWLAAGARTAADKVLVIVPPIAAFVALGLEHSVANMSLLPMGLVIRDCAGPEFWAKAGVSAVDYPGLTWAGAARNLAASTLGNMIGGMLIGAAYWFAYLRQK